MDGNLEQLILDLKESLEREIVTLGDRFDARLASMEAHLDRIDTRLAALEFPIPALQRAMDGIERSQRALLATQQKQQQAIDELYRRIHPPPPPAQGTPRAYRPTHRPAGDRGGRCYICGMRTGGRLISG